jgi:hypothetical protein
VRLVLPPAELAPGLTLTVAPMVARPVHLDDWQRRTLESGVPDGARVRTFPAETAETEASGWPVTLIASEVVRGEEVIERRLHGFYDLGLYVAVVSLRGASAAAARAVEAVVRALLLAAVPDFSVDAVSALFEVWEGL